MNNFLKSKELPYILTLLFAALAWSVTHLGNRYIDSPAIEWRFTTEKKSCGEIGVYEIMNLSRKQHYKNLKFSLHLNKESFTWCDVQRIPPAGNVSLDYPKNDIFERSTKVDKIEIVITEFHPLWKLKICVKLTGGEYPKLNILSEKSVNLVEGSFETFILKNEIWILWAVICFWALLIISYLIYLQYKKS